MNRIDLAGLLDPTLEAVEEACRLVRDHWDRPRDIRKKGRIDLVTETDMAVEAALSSRLREVLPQAAFVAEETAAAQPLGDLAWIVDPLDGTTNFAHGVPFVGVSVGLWVGDSIGMGVVALPILGETFWAVRGQGAFKNNQRIHVSESEDLEDCLVATGFPYDIQRWADPVLRNVQAVLGRCRGVRRCGAAAVDMVYVACGRYDAFFEPALKPWDTAAGWLLVEEAGGSASQFDPDAPYRLGAETLLVTNGRVHRRFAALLA